MTPQHWTQTVHWHDAHVAAIAGDAAAGTLEFLLEIDATPYRLSFTGVLALTAEPPLATLAWSEGFDGEILGVRCVPEDSRRFRIRFSVQTFDYVAKRRAMLVIDGNVGELRWEKVS